jgi:hypothetical protein
MEGKQWQHSYTHDNSIGDLLVGTVYFFRLNPTAMFTLIPHSGLRVAIYTAYDVDYSAGSPSAPTME